MCFAEVFIFFFAEIISRKRLDGDSEINWQYNMPSNIIYAYIKRGAMLDKLDITLLLNNKFLNNRLWWYRKNELSERLRMDSNRSKTTCSRFCRIVCCLKCVISCLFYCWCWHIITAEDHEFESNPEFKSYAILTILDLSTGLSVNKSNRYMTLLLTAKTTCQGLFNVDISLSQSEK